METLPDACLKAGLFSEARDTLSEVVAIRTVKEGADNPSTINTLLALARVCLAEGDYAGAEKLLQQCLPTLEKEQPGLSTTFEAQSMLGEALAGQKRYIEAKPLLLQAYERLKRRDRERPSPSHAQPIKEAGKRIVQLYDAMGKPGEADTWRKRVQ